MPPEIYAALGALALVLILAEVGATLWDLLWEFIR